MKRTLASAGVNMRVYRNRLATVLETSDSLITHKQKIPDMIRTRCRTRGISEHGQEGTSGFDNVRSTRVEHWQRRRNKT